MHTCIMKEFYRIFLFAQEPTLKAVIIINFDNFLCDLRKHLYILK